MGGTNSENEEERVPGPGNPAAGRTSGPDEKAGLSRDAYDPPEIQPPHRCGAGRKNKAARKAAALKRPGLLKRSFRITPCLGCYIGMSMMCHTPIIPMSSCSTMWQCNIAIPA